MPRNILQQHRDKRPVTAMGMEYGKVEPRHILRIHHLEPRRPRGNLSRDAVQMSDQRADHTGDALDQRISTHISVRVRSSAPLAPRPQMLQQQEATMMVQQAQLGVKRGGAAQRARNGLGVRHPHVVHRSPRPRRQLVQRAENQRQLQR
jgi:hypothetical protein